MSAFKIILAANCILLAASCKHVEENKKAETETVTALKATEVLSLHPAKPVVLPGELHSWNKVNLYSKVKGFVKLVKADRGSRVKRGQVLAVLDAPEIVAELDQAKGHLHAAQASFHESQAKFSSSGLTYARLLKASHTEGAVAAHELELAQSKISADSAAVSAAEGNLKAAQSHFRTKSEMVNYLSITAPFEGVIIERNISPGALIGAGDANPKPLFVLEDNSTLRLTVAIPENYANSIQKNMDVTFRVNAVMDKKFSASFGRSSESVLDKHRVMMTEFDIDNRNGALKAGMYAEVQLSVKRSSPTLFVPRSAVVSSSENVFVIQEKDHRSQWVPVKKGISLDTLTEVFGEILAGDLIVKEASEELREGQLIDLKK